MADEPSMTSWQTSVWQVGVAHAFSFLLLVICISVAFLFEAATERDGKM